ncbi:hypothetical protein EOPP23_05315 [Endozoicomonas sp. OPT23]|uniref:hypothetical protein n=1 Tax=Endozoicomonas sp. OPT23 TaxID=2072845 RepID=UPI00129B5F6D|nr:hypothetical protein [Endozoicomonas sp. OPT23]MRI32402.1 hypothetical protein [Endozoicomonas sp. OPT23]
MKKLVWVLMLVLIAGLGYTIANDIDLPDEFEEFTESFEEFFDGDETAFNEIEDGYDWQQPDQNNDTDSYQEYIEE